MPDLIACVGRRRIAVSRQDGNILMRIMILDETNVLANLVLEPAEAGRLVDALVDCLPARRSIARKKTATPRETPSPYDAGRRR